MWYYEHIYFIETLPALQRNLSKLLQPARKIITVDTPGSRGKDEKYVIQWNKNVSFSE